MYRTILVPTDGSDGAAAALEHALDLAERYGATVHALNVVGDADLLAFRDEDAVADVDARAVREGLEERGDRLVAEACERAEVRGVDCVTAVRSGGPAHRGIVDYAESEGVDLVVMGTHGRRGFDRLLMGSVAEKVVRLSPVPVMTVRREGLAGGEDEDDHRDGARATGGEQGDPE
ncbi:universal stress protein [Halobacteriales archaeon QS_5_70_17]|nr:MAG: universal stress protein [Halobacteriales archaeon QS_5_70_17]